MAKHLNRREFLAAATALPALSALSARPAFADEPHQPAPYLALEKFIAPGNDEFPEEKAAAKLAGALQKVLLSASSPELALNGNFASPLASSFRKIAPDLQEAVFSSPSDVGSFGKNWQDWVKSLGKIRRAWFDPLPSDEVRFAKTRNSG